ncbi:hypothetical protein A2704_03650 [Candidatus Kaiserbacteria bacterium RIFCSPHIGHO2_01_FULL_54_36b]|uniref:Uncharacterized protein n=1 Tax=Candidatus Kaiserbacteria bacterium RIFCSPHIGHO2_01_FULL_54_36b TaxID=1798483 RepID=A0A1F6CRP7_9BACT|nr:MAG: hypothetical protein A2704_03650 [Candidatus Kaiserbacteria bacterium RIFCSPHIGHO2_01_FULL_54_36b]
MDTSLTQGQLDEQLKERFGQLPKTIQNAITSADVQKQLRALADTNKLHLDQWQLLENDVMLTLLGFQPTEELAHHLKADLDISLEIATSLADDISRIVFQPIREQLERELSHPDAKAANVSGVEAARTQILGSEDKPAAPVAPAVLPATPPAEPPSAKIARAPVSESYKAGETSTARKSVHDDPYRESPA